jgi:purine/pyrimidine-nucleoside phosphorylase
LINAPRDLRAKRVDLREISGPNDIEPPHVLDIRSAFKRLLRPMPNVPEEFVSVTAMTKANIYFDGRVVSHAIVFPDGSKKTLGLIFPGEYHFNTQAAERMQIVAGNCKILLDGQSAPKGYTPGEAFDVPGKSGFTITVDQGICEYICSFLS